MKRYALFCFSDTYPLGGWGDFRASFGDIRAALGHARHWKASFDSYQIVDLFTGQEIHAGSTHDWDDQQPGAEYSLLEHVG